MAGEHGEHKVKSLRELPTSIAPPRDLWPQIEARLQVQAPVQPPVRRRVWAATIADGLAAMVEDRRTDEVLERIERSANADDDPWDAL